MESERGALCPAWEVGCGQAQGCLGKRKLEGSDFQLQCVGRARRVHRSESESDQEMRVTAQGLREVLVAVTGWFVSPGYQAVSKVSW